MGFSACSLLRQLPICRPPTASNRIRGDHPLMCFCLYLCTHINIEHIPKSTQKYERIDRTKIHRQLPGLAEVCTGGRRGRRRRLENVWKTRSKNKIRDIYWWRIIGAISTTIVSHERELSSYAMSDVASDGEERDAGALFMAIGHCQQLKQYSIE